MSQPAPYSQLTVGTVNLEEDSKLPRPSQEVDNVEGALSSSQSTPFDPEDAGMEREDERINDGISC